MLAFTIDSQPLSTAGMFSVFDDKAMLSLHPTADEVSEVSVGSSAPPYYMHMHLLDWLEH